MSENKKENYHIISLIGQGAYGQVYKARKKLTGQFVAIKSIKKKGKEQKDIQVMRDEIEILKKLKHENIILLLDSFQTNSEFILVTELGQGELFNIIEDDHSLEETQIRKIAQQLVRALHYIHSNRITHRDMKPQNILMTSNGIIKLCDFGFARHMSYKTEVLTSLKGTPLYMAPEVVKEEPYNHTADLWSLGVILYELATGTPPFTAPNLISLVEHISKDPIVYPDIIAGDFKNFLKGLLNKDPKRRLGWPQLLSHPFIKQTQQQKLDRKKKTQIFSNWVEDNHFTNQEQDIPSVIGGTIYARSISQNNLDDRSRDISPKKESHCSDAVWNKYYSLSADQKGASLLRRDPTFLDSLLKILEMNINQIVRVKQKRTIFSIALKTLTQIMMKSKVPQNKKQDNSKNLNIPNHLLHILKGLLKVDSGRQFIDLISDITKLIGLLSRSSFHKNFGIQMVYVRSFVPLMPELVKTAVLSNDQPNQSFTVNLLRTTGIFANNASANHIRSFSFYKDLVEKKFIQECMQITRHYYENNNVIKIFVQVIGAFMHPVYGDIQCFPWKRNSNAGIQEYKECSTMLECVRQTIINSLLESEVGPLLTKTLNIQEQSSLLPKISIIRIILQSLRLSKQFTEYILFQEKQVVKSIFQTLQNSDQVIFGTTCQVISQLIRYCRQKKKEKILQNYLISYFPTILSKCREGKQPLMTFASLLVLQEIIIIQNGVYLQKIVEQILHNSQYLKSISELLTNSQNNKLEQMRKIQGSNYGIHGVGIYDPAFLFLHRLLSKLQKDNPKQSDQLIKAIKESKIHLRIRQIMTGLSSKTDLSPKGLISLLMLLYDMMSVAVWDQFSDQKFLKSLIELLIQEQVDFLAEWPVCLGGGEVTVC